MSDASIFSSANAPLAPARKQANRLKDQFLAIVSHELRTPLNAILGWADILRRGALEPDRHERAFRAIYDSARRQAQLIDELLDVSRIMSGKLRLELSPEVDVARGRREGAWKWCSRRPTRSACTSPSTLEVPIGTICADSAACSRSSGTCSTNAIKFSPDGGAIRIRIRREADDGRDSW